MYRRLDVGACLAAIIMECGFTKFVCGMRQLNLQSDLPLRHGSTPIAIGVFLLLASNYWPALPIVTAMALVAAGATGETCARLAGSPLLPIAVAGHLFVYSSLYFIFVGAVCHAALAKPHGGIGALLILDVAASAFLMAFAVRMAVVAVARVSSR